MLSAQWRTAPQGDGGQAGWMEGKMDGWMDGWMELSTFPLSPPF